MAEAAADDDFKERKKESSVLPTSWWVAGAAGLSSAIYSATPVPTLAASFPCYLFPSIHPQWPGGWKS